MSTFETNPKTLKLLLTQIHAGELALPDFQRDFVWDPGAIEELIESIMRNYPAGSLLFLKHHGEGFRIREFQEAPELKSTMGASYLVLDGQQRLTSLYQAFYGKGEHKFYIDLQELIDSGDIEAAVWHESAKYSQRHGYHQINLQAERLLCPIETIMLDGFDTWVDAVMDLRPEQDDSRRELRNQLRQIQRQWIQPILDYQFPVVTLSAQTPLDAVCKMFETLNRRGVKLTVFELLMARSYSENVSLRTLWETALDQYPILEQFDIDPYYVLQVISLLNGRSIKRQEILDMHPSTVAQSWTKATTALADALAFLRRNAGVLNAKLLPYNTMIVPLAAAWSNTGDIKGAKEAVRNGKFIQWFWASIFSQMYEKGQSSRSVSDFKELCAWINADDSREPTALKRLYFTPEMFYEITPKQRALYRGCLAMLVSRGALDFHNAEKLTYDYLDKYKVDDHHIFPQNYLAKNNTSELSNNILNRTLIDKKTNIRISDKAPSKYTQPILAELSEKQLKAIFASHGINLDFLLDDNFDGFLRARSHAFMTMLEDTIARPIPRTPIQSDEENDEDFDDDERPNAKSRFDPSSINAEPIALLAELPAHIKTLFNLLTQQLTAANQDIWWRATMTRVTFWYGDKVLATLRLARTGLHFHVFTDGHTFENVEQVSRTNKAGALWGRLKMKDEQQLQKCVDALLESSKRLQKAQLEGRNTGWWALVEKPTKEVA